MRKTRARILAANCYIILIIGTGSSDTSAATETPGRYHSTNWAFYALCLSPDGGLLAGKSASAYNMLSQICHAKNMVSPQLRENIPLINDQLLGILRCPQDHSALSRAEPELVERTNRAIKASQLMNQAGQKLKKEIDGGLVRAAGDVMYPVVDEIPVMLPDEAIELSQLS